MAIEWSGRLWDVRTWSGGPSRDALWSDKNVWVDEAGCLHLKITRDPSGKWISAEVDSRQVGWGYGKYRIITLGSLATLPKGAVFGLFTYGSGPDKSNREIDFEASAWGLNEIAWDHTYYSPDGSANVMSRMPVGNAGLFVHELEWLPSSVKLSTADDKGRVISSYSNSSLNAPVPDKELFLINLWVYNRNKMSECEVVVKSFDFYPAVTI
jgi:hypothetical protein